MKRQAISNGGWFDLDAAEKYKENTYWNGRNQISKATGDKFLHEALYCTKNGVYVLNHWSQWAGSSESWTRISAEEAAAWLVQNGYEPPKGELAKAVESQEV